MLLSSQAKGEIYSFHQSRLMRNGKQELFGCKLRSSVDLLSTIEVRFSISFPNVALRPVCSSIFDDIFFPAAVVVVASQLLPPIFIVLLFCKYWRILSAIKQRPFPNCTRHVGHLTIFPRHRLQTICPLTHW